MNNAVIYVLLFIAGFLTGAALCYAILAQIYKHKRVRDELLKARREATKAKRTLDKFLKTSLDMFSDLDLAHRQYAMFLKEAAQRIAPQEEPVHEFMHQKYSEPFIKRSEETKSEHKKEAAARISAQDRIVQAAKEPAAQQQEKAPALEDTADAQRQQSANIEVKDLKEEISKL